MRESNILADKYICKYQVQVTTKEQAQISAEGCEEEYITQIF